MTLFTLLLALTWERLFKKNDRWQIDTHLEMIFRRLSAPSLLQTLLLALLGMAATAALLWLTQTFGTQQMGGRVRQGGVNSVTAFRSGNEPVMR